MLTPTPSARYVLLGVLLAACGPPPLPAPEPAADRSGTSLTAAAIGAGDNTLSFEPWLSATNGWGPPERDRSNGETAAGDGRPLTLAGVTYARGFGVHANSTLSFALDGRCEGFRASVGVDDEVGDRGSVVFRVSADGAALYDSGVLTGASATRSVNVDVRGRRTLTLTVTDAGNGNAYDHADWAAATVTGCTASATAPAPSAAVRVNAGGPQQTVDGVTWSACTAVGACGGLVTGGFAYAPTVPAQVGAVSPANAAVYASEWTGGATTGVPAGQTAFAYRVPLASGSYLLRLHFSELNKTAPGQRVFDVNVEGQPALPRLDVHHEAGGAHRALVRALPVTVTDGALDVQFVRQVENAKLSALEVLPAAPARVSWLGSVAAPLPLYEAQGAAVGNRLYVLGGFDRNAPGPVVTRAAQVFDPLTATWRALRTMPEALTHAGSATDGPYVFLAGGFVGNHPGPATAHVWRYDTRTDTWSALPDLPRAVGAGALVRAGRALHFFGGVERDPLNPRVYLRDSGAHWALDLDAPGAWQARAPLPGPRNHLGGALLGGRIYAVGGQTLGDETTGNRTDVHVYDPQRDTWETGVPLPLPLGHIGASTLAWRGQLLVLGGVTQNDPGAREGRESARVLLYDPAARRWSDLSPLPAVRQSPVADVVNDRPVITTGSTFDGPTNTTWIGQP